MAVYEGLLIPRSGSQILSYARKFAPRITLQDIRHILRKLEAFDAVQCINPHERTGRIYVRSDQSLSDYDVEWPVYWGIIRAKAKCAVLNEIATIRMEFSSRPKTATEIKRGLRNYHSMSLNAVLECLESLRRSGLVEISSRTRIRDCKIYKLSEKGEKVLKMMLMAQFN